jgi:hypothetical protein
MNRNEHAARPELRDQEPRRKLLPALPEPSSIKTTGRLWEYEVEGLRRAYVEGASGAVLIGMRCQARVLTMQIPARQTEHSSSVIMEHIGVRLRTMGCDGWIYARRVHLRNNPDDDREDALLVDEALVEDSRQQRQQCLVSLTDPARRWRLGSGSCLDDGVSRVLCRVLTNNGAI